MNVGLIGFGVVGSHVYRVLTDYKDTITKRTGINITVHKVGVRREVEYKKKFPGVPFTEDIQSLIQDSDVVIEVIGGENPAKSYIDTALSNLLYIVRKSGCI